MTKDLPDFSNLVLHDRGVTSHFNRLSQSIDDLEALGLYFYLCSLPPNWNINKEHLRKKFGIGIHKLDSILRILLACRLVEYVQENYGRFGKISLHILSGNEFVPYNLPEMTRQMPQMPHVKSAANSRQIHGKLHKISNEINDPSGGTETVATETVATEIRDININNNKITKASKKKDKIKNSSSIDIDGLFLLFWQPFPKKVNKKEARKIFERGRHYLHLDKIIADIARRNGDCTQWKGKRCDDAFIPHPSSYLNKERYNDEASNEIINGEKVDAITNPAELREELNQLNEKIIKAEEKESEFSDWTTEKDPIRKVEKQKAWGECASHLTFYKNKRNDILKILAKQNPSPATPRKGEERVQQTPDF
jgi:hypothetical protein